MGYRTPKSTAHKRRLQVPGRLLPIYDRRRAPPELLARTEAEAANNTQVRQTPAGETPTRSNDESSDSGEERHVEVPAIDSAVISAERDDDYVPEPEPPRRRRIPQDERRYRPTRDRHESDDNEYEPSPASVLSRRTRSDRRPPRRSGANTRGSIAANLAVNGDVLPGSGNQSIELESHDDKENMDVDIEAENVLTGLDSDLLDSDSLDTESQDSDSQDSDLDSDAPTLASVGQRLPPALFHSGRDMRRNKASSRVPTSHNPGYTTAQLRNVLSRKRPRREDQDQEDIARPRKIQFTLPPAASRRSRSGIIKDSEAPAKKVFASILHIPKSLTIPEIGAAFEQLREESQEFARKNFNFKLTEEQVEAWPLHLLGWDYVALETIAGRLAIGGKYTWRSFFTGEEGRVPLVHAIIGEYLKHHVFNHTAFSFEGENMTRLREIDEEYLGYDAFVRNKHRATLLHELILTPGFWLDQRENMHRACEELALAIMAVVEPLLPPQLFNPVISSHSLLPKNRIYTALSGKASEADLQNAKHVWNHILHELQEIIYKAASLHLSIRMSGRDGTTISILDVEKGSMYQDVTHADLVNADDCGQGLLDQQEGSGEQLQIKMTCWGRVEAVVPHGVDLEQYEEIAAEFENNTRRGKPDDLNSWESYFAKYLPRLPPELQKNPFGGGSNQTSKAWDLELARQVAIQEKRRRQRQGLRIEDENPNQTSRRGNYVTYYNAVNGSQVYCEWDVPGVLQQPLEDAVAEARESAGLYYKLEDKFIAMSNEATRMLGREWPGILLLGVIIVAACPLAFYITSKEMSSRGPSIHDHSATGRNGIQWLTETTKQFRGKAWERMSWPISKTLSPAVDKLTTTITHLSTGTSSNISMSKTSAFQALSIGSGGAALLSAPTLPLPTLTDVPNFGRPEKTNSVLTKTSTARITHSVPRTPTTLVARVSTSSKLTTRASTVTPSTFKLSYRSLNPEYEEVVRRLLEGQFEDLEIVGLGNLSSDVKNVIYQAARNKDERKLRRVFHNLQGDF